VTAAGLEVGASVTLSALMRALRRLVAEREPHETSTFAAMLEQVRSRQAALRFRRGLHTQRGKPCLEVCCI
jgi:hypothetical protein